MISVVLLGAGNLGQQFFKALVKNQTLNLIQWYNRSLGAIKPFSNEVSITDNLKELKQADIYILAVSDDRIALLSSALPFENRLVVHTSGSTSIHDLDKKLRRGVLYPLQSFTKDRPVDFTNVPLCLEALNKEDYVLLQGIASGLGSPSYKISTEQRKTLHLSAVFVNNFGNQLFRIAHEISDAQSINFDILKPLILETAEKIKEMSPYMAQTGPALRGDKKTVKRHMKQLQDSPHKEVYELLTKSIQKTHGKR